MKKWQDRGYWISKQYYWQSMVYYLYNAAKYRSLTFFSACNPALSFGGMLDDNKTEAYSLIPDRYLPKMLIYDFKVDLEKQIKENSIQFPVVVKPNMGYKGYAVRECKDLDELKYFVGKLEENKEWLIQEYIDLEHEYSIMYYYYPVSKIIGLTSVSSKKYPFVVGDGISSMEKLIDQYENPFVDKYYLRKKWESKFDMIPTKNQKIELHHIGNYSRGSKFCSLMQEKDDQLASAMHNIFNGRDEIYFGRFDIKANSMEDVRQGEFKIMEINGAKSEPLHIYDPKYGFWSRIKDVRRHWKIMTHIVDERRAQGYQFPGNIEGLRSVQAAKKGVR